MSHVLLVDDSSHDIELIEAALATCGLTREVEIARDGVQALAHLERKLYSKISPPDLPVLVLLDLKLPKLDGMEVLAHMKAHPALARIPVAMISSSGEERDIAGCRRLHADAYIVKPLSFDELVRRLQSLQSFWEMPTLSPSVGQP